MSGITTHVLDTAGGAPAEGVVVSLAVREGKAWREIARVLTGADGRARPLPEDLPLEAATYRLRFETGAWLANRDIEAFHPWVDVAFAVHDPSRDYHVPLLLSPYGYTTYRGS
jgi:5-hydroxyisourate hydrolase